MNMKFRRCLNTVEIVSSRVRPGCLNQRRPGPSRECGPFKRYSLPSQTGFLAKVRDER